MGNEPRQTETPFDHKVPPSEAEQVTATDDLSTRKPGSDDRTDFDPNGENAPAKEKTVAPGVGGAVSEQTAVGPRTGLSEVDLERPAGERIVLGDYEVVKRLGAGGMGAVYKARQVSLDRDVALKVLFRSLAANKPDFVPRFYREAKVMAKLNHPNVVTCFGVGEAHGLHYLAMEYVDGGSVSDLLKKHERFSVGDALHITLACLRALEHAHELNLVHRDVKPDNLLLTSKGTVKLADLGLAKALDDDLSLTQSGMGAGTPHYMSPEQTKSAKHVDARTDIYAVGCMLYRFLTSKVPFEGETVVELFIAKESGKYEPAKKINSEVSERLDLLIDRMLAKKPELRPQSCTEVIREIEGIGLANDRLTYFGGRPKMPENKSGLPPTVKMQAGATAKPPAKATGAPVTPAGEFWYLQTGKKAGKIMVQKLTKEQIMARLKSNEIPPTAQVSRDPKAGYRSIGSYPDFEYLARSRLQKEKADRRGEQMKSFYQNLEKEERRYKRWKWIKRLTGNTFGWLIILGVFALLGGLGYVIFLKWADIIGSFK